MQMKAIDRFQLASALAEQERDKLPLGQLITDRWFCSSKSVLDALGRQTGLETIDLDEVQIRPALASLLPRELALKLRVIPFAIESGARQVLRVAIAAPGRGLELSELTADLCSASRHQVRLFLATDDAIDRSLASAYAKLPLPGMVEVLVAGWVGEEGQSHVEALIDAGFRARVARATEVLNSTQAQLVLCRLPYLAALCARGNIPRGRLIVYSDSVERVKSELERTGAHGFVVSGQGPGAIARAVRTIVAM